MREIKFRAWDKKYKVMINPDDIHPRVMQELITGEGEVLEIHESHSYAGTDVTYDDISEERVLMQFTGLHDKNGKEIFEGDIVPVKVSIHKGWKQGWIHLKRQAVVEYVENEMRYMFVSDDEKYGKQYVPFDKGIAQSYEVIGNVFENEDVLS